MPPPPPLVSMCPELQAPADGSVQYNSVVVGSVAEYSCNEGFLLEGVTNGVLKYSQNGYLHKKQQNKILNYYAFHLQRLRCAVWSC